MLRRAHNLYVADSDDTVSFVSGRIKSLGGDVTCHPDGNISVRLGLGLRNDGTLTNGVIHVRRGGFGVDADGYWNNSKDFEISADLFLDSPEPISHIRITPETMELGPIVGGNNEGCVRTDPVGGHGLLTPTPLIFDDGLTHALEGFFNESALVTNGSHLILAGELGGNTGPDLLTVMDASVDWSPFAPGSYPTGDVVLERSELVLTSNSLRGEFAGGNVAIKGDASRVEINGTDLEHIPLILRNGSMLELKSGSLSAFSAVIQLHDSHMVASGSEVRVRRPDDNGGEKPAAVAKGNSTIDISAGMIGGVRTT